MITRSTSTRSINGSLREVNAILTIAYRDILRFMRDPSRLIGTLILPVLFVGLLGGGLQGSFGSGAGYNLFPLIFTGVFAQTLFQSTAFGIISLIEDRENDFSQEIFISPISRYSIIFGKILGESLVAFMQAIFIVLFGLILFSLLHVPFSLLNLLGLLVVALPVCILGGAFGLILLSFFGSQRAANQVLPFLIFPQFFLAGVFNPLSNVPLALTIISKIAPLTYAVDLTRNVFYAGRPEYSKVVVAHPLVNLSVIALLFTIFLIVGTSIFVNSERNR